MNLNPMSHAHDPSTSHKAESLMLDSGALGSNTKKVAWLVSMYPDKTASELTCRAVAHFPVFTNMGYDKALIEVRRRLSSMKDTHVTQGTARVALLNKPEVTWRAKA